MDGEILFIDIFNSLNAYTDAFVLSNNEYTLEDCMTSDGTESVNKYTMPYGNVACNATAVAFIIGLRQEGGGVTGVEISD